MDTIRSILQFLWEIRYIIIFYIVGDSITTIYALAYGYEANFFLAEIIFKYGIYSVFLLKLLFIALIFYNYKKLIDLDHSMAPLLWKGVKYSISTLGIFLTVNNLLIVYLNWSLLRIIGIGI
ncbi:MAG: hypothetical protein K8R64_02175 [Methanosarcinaceae archaeon]|nr:hypothetical protein [Methanosarcinaceae archaeon]